jgi:L-alanine-DL-glutamate epimerase-like enolase superfamily enzyme
VPEIFQHYAERARLAEEIDLREPDGEICFIGVAQDSSWPFLVVTQRYAPAGYGFDPGVLIVAETNVLFVGAGERLLAYDLLAPKRLWEDAADCGFWRWARHGSCVVMSAELELAAWDLEGKKLWSTFVEPPWDYEVNRGQVELDVMGDKSSFPLRLGPSQRR